jgi:tRNA nucleotidyltransferase (CCA-adding enzyme)
MMSNIFLNFYDNLIFEDKPSSFIFKLKDENLLNLFPELELLTQTPQDPLWHPEGNVFEHTMLVIDQAAIIKNRINNQEDKIVLMFAALCHDFGKPLTTTEKNGRIVSPNHEAKGAEPSEKFLRKFELSETIIEKIVKLVKEHLRPATLHKAKPYVSFSAIKRLSYRVDIEMLLLVAEADHFGRTTEDAINREFPAGQWLKQMYNKTNKSPYTSRPKALLNGNILIEIGYPEGKLLGKILKTIYNYQLKKKIFTGDEALALLEKLFPIKQYHR